MGGLFLTSYEALPAVHSTSPEEVMGLSVVTRILFTKNLIRG